MDLVVYDDRDQRYVPLLVALALALVTAALVGGLAFLLGREPAVPAAPLSAVSAPRSGLSAPQAGARDETGCTAAFEQAQAALRLATRMEGALDEQTRRMDDLLAERLTREQVLDRSLPPLTAAAKDRRAFLDAVSTFEQARAACQQ